MKAVRRNEANGEKIVEWQITLILFDRFFKVQNRGGNRCGKTEISKRGPFYTDVHQPSGTSIHHIRGLVFLLLSALHPLSATVMVLIIFIIIITVSLTGGTFLALTKLANIVKMCFLYFTRGRTKRTGSRKGLLEKVEAVGIKTASLREFYLETDVQPTLIVDTLVSGHTLVRDRSYGIGLKHFTRLGLHVKSSLVEVLQVELAATESFAEGNLALGEKIIALAEEAVVLLLLEYNNDITGLDTGLFIGSTAESDLLSVLHTLIDMYLQDLPLLHGLLALTLLALILLRDGLASTLTVGAGGLHLLDHTGSNLSHYHLHTRAVTYTAINFRTGVVASAAVAVRANSMTAHSKLCRLSIVEVFQLDLQGVDYVLSLARTTVTPSTTTEAEQVEYVGTSSSTSTVATHCFLTALHRTIEYVVTAKKVPKQCFHAPCRTASSSRSWTRLRRLC